jgi:iron complex transport system permease protein
MLRNPLASPDVIGISSGASAAAVVGLVVLELSGTATSVVAIAAALVTALVIYGLAFKDGVVGSRLILIGIGVAAMLDSVVGYVIVRAAQWDLQVAMRWLTGSLNNATWDQVAPLAVAVAVAVPLLLSQARPLELLQHGDDSAAALGGCCASSPRSCSSRSRPPRRGPSPSWPSCPGRSRPGSWAPAAR